MTHRLHIGLIAQGGRNWVGGLELTKNLTVAVTRYCRSVNRDVKVTVFGIGGRDASVVDFLADNNIEFADIPFARQPSLVRRFANRYLFLEKLSAPHPNQHFANVCDERGIDFVYPIASMPESAKCRSAVWIPDLQHCRLPQFFTPKDCQSRTDLFESYAQTARRIVFSSRDSEHDFAELFPNARVMTKVLPFRVIMPNDVLNQPKDTVRDKYHLPDQFFLVCGQFWAHKNQGLVLEALERLINNHPDILVVMTGRLSDYRNESHIDQFLAGIHVRGLSRNVRILGLVPKTDQLQLMRASVAVIQPSLFEGWSTVVEECHALGKQLILSDIPSHIEQAVPRSRFFPRHSADRLAEVMAELWLTLKNSGDFDECAAAESYERLVLKFGEQFCELAEQP